MYVPWRSIDVITIGRVYWARRRSWQRKYNCYTNHYKWVVMPQAAPFITGYGVLISRVHYDYSGLTPKLRAVYNGFVHDLSRILTKYDIRENYKWEDIAADPFRRAYWGYKVANDLLNKVVGRSNRSILADSIRLSEANLSTEEAISIERRIKRSNLMICYYDFDRNVLLRSDEL